MDEFSGHRAAIEKLSLATEQAQRDTKMTPNIMPEPFGPVLGSVLGSGMNKILNPIGPIASTIGLGVPTINPVTLTMRVGILEDRISRMEQELEKVMIMLTDRLGALETKVG